MRPKVIQITVVPGFDLAEDREQPPIILALTEDGSIWENRYNAYGNSWSTWQQLPPLPEINN